MCVRVFRQPHASQEMSVLFTLLSRLVNELTEVLFILIYPSFSAVGNDTQWDRGTHSGKQGQMSVSV